MKEILIVGAGDFGRELVWLIEEINKQQARYVIRGFLDDAEEKQGMVIGGYPVLGRISDLKSFVPDDKVVATIAMQDGSIRKRIVESFAWFQNWETLIHPNVVLADSVKIGKGTVLCPFVAVSVDTVIGEGCLINIGTTIGHDCSLGDYVSIMSNSAICGHVQIGAGAYLATSVSVVPGKKIGAYAKVGVGSSVIGHVKDGIIVMGNPARRMRF